MKEFPYNTARDPSMPVCDVRLTAASTGRQVALTAIIDTGADGTIVPDRYLQQIGARRALEARLRSQWGEARRVAHARIPRLPHGVRPLPVR